MALQSQLLGGDPKLEAASVSDPAHVVPGARGPHVAKIQQALIRLDGASISQDSAYGPATAAAVRAFKQKRQILNFAGQIDDIVGKKTIAALDSEMLQAEKGGGGGGGGGNGRSRGLVGPAVTTKTHTLVYFSGKPDNSAVEGVPLIGSLREDVQIDMENLTTVNADKIVLGFGGSRNNKAGLAAALAFIIGTHDPRGKLIIYGFSVGALNGLQLCRTLNGLIGSKVDLLVTVDVPGTDDFGGQPESGTIPANVVLNRNYFQIDSSLVKKGPSGIRTTGQNTDCSKDKFPETFKFRHGQMEKVTRTRTVGDMRSVINASK